MASMVSTLYKIVLWVIIKVSPLIPIEIPKQKSIHHFKPKTGLAILLPSTHKYQDPNNNNILHSYTIPSSVISSSTSSSSPMPLSSIWMSSDMGDLIGTENGVYDMIISGEETTGEKLYTCTKKIIKVGYKMKINDYPLPRPQPLSSLALSRDLMGHDVSWTLKKTFLDGRLIMKRERVHRLRYLESHRENGRLKLYFATNNFQDDDNYNKDHTRV